MRIAVVGGGILGLATARLIAESTPDAEIVLLEKEQALALHQTARNSGVVHAGLYYAPGSLKARLCRRGLGLLRDFCAARKIPYQQCGKVVAATRPTELDRLRSLGERAQANGVPGLRWLEGGQLTEVEPHLEAIAGLHSPETAIVDFAAVADAFAADVRARGGKIRTGTEVVRVWGGTQAPSVELAGGAIVEADRVVVCAGLQADRIARASGESAQPRIVPFRGEYWQLRPERTGLVHGLIYPVPDPALPFLGVHLTRRIDGAVWLGPNAVLSLAREGYERKRFSPRDTYETLSWPGTFRMMRRHWRSGLNEVVRSAHKRSFIGELQRYVPSLAVDDVIRAPAGIRAQAVDRDGSLVDDFRLSITRHVVWVRNAPSPAATSSLAIAEELSQATLG
ncbi:MAG TPA: L-2-hydroxyglutarate oxidase [Solirubrobacteraceae bacterium]|jgi:L-2-hydroxyglutarate oxidase LhgO